MDAVHGAEPRLLLALLLLDIPPMHTVAAPGELIYQQFVSCRHRASPPATDSMERRGVGGLHTAERGRK